MKPFMLKCRSRAGQHTIDDLTTDSSLLDLKAFVLSITGFEQSKLLLKHGYPPTPIHNDDNDNLGACGIRNGDTIIAEESAVPMKQHSPPQQNLPKASNKRSSQPTQEDQQHSKIAKETRIERKVVPANNSCLFASIYFCLHGVVDQSKNTVMRRIVADTVLSNPEEYSEALLGKPPKEYANWILQPESWGGGIELAILCDYYSMEITVIDVKNTRSEKFGEQHSNRIMLIYDGIHYDPLYETGSPLRTIFSSKDDMILTKALSLAEREKANRQFTDVVSFSLRCLVCSKGFVGAKEATEHAEETGHVNFGEY